MVITWDIVQPQIGWSIRVAREHQAITYPEAARGTDFNLSRYVMVDAGLGNVRWEELMRICKFLKIEVIFPKLPDLHCQPFLGKWLAYLRVMMGCSIQTASEVSDCRKSAIVRIERGDRLAPALLKEYTKFLGVTIEPTYKNTSLRRHTPFPAFRD